MTASGEAKAGGEIPKYTEAAKKAIELREFLRGAGPMDGLWFGEMPADGPRFWWRKGMSARIDALLAENAALTKRAEAAEMREKALLDSTEVNRKAALAHNAAQPSPDVVALTDTGLLLDAYKAVLVLHRVMDKHGLTAGASAAENIADRIVAAHPEFPGLCALRGAALARLKGGEA